MNKENLGKNIYVFTSSVYKFTTDTILLSYFSRPSEKDTVMEIGSGCGALTLLWFRDININKAYCIEIQEEACNLFNESIIYNNLQNKISVINKDINSFYDPSLHNKFDIVVCNPPYKDINTGILSSTNERQLINHQISCNIDDIARFSNKHLCNGGRLCLCIRPESLVAVFNNMRENNIEPKRIRFVHYSKDKPSKLLLIEGRKNGKPNLEVLPPLILKNDDMSDTTEIKKIYSYMREE